MLNPERLLGQLLLGGLGGRGRRRRRSGLLGGLSTGAKAQIGMGLLGVAIAAYEHYTKQSEPGIPTSPGPDGAAPPQSVAPMPRSSLPVANGPAPASSTASDAMLLVQAMVAAAAADGVIDETERAQIVDRANQAGFDADTKAFLERELANPKSLAVVVASARPDLAVDLYAASCAAIDADTEAERSYLETLASHLKLSPEVREDIHRKLELV